MYKLWHWVDCEQDLFTVLAKYKDSRAVPAQLGRCNQEPYADRDGELLGTVSIKNNETILQIDGHPTFL